MFELRWLVRNSWDGPEKVLQYRTQFEAIDYSSKDHLSMMKWSEWKDVPTVDESNSIHI
jgi:hypothetical protein